MEQAARALARALIVEFEGVNQPGRWPGGESGVTLGYGYDLGYVRADMLLADWADEIYPPTLERLATAVGVKGGAARDLAPRFADLIVSREASARVLEARMLPRYWNLTAATFRGAEHLPAGAQAALLDLVFNRGPALHGERRQEMRAIVGAVARQDLHAIARQLVAMKRLWIGQRLDGLLLRRDAEAALVLSAAQGESTTPDDVHTLVRLIRARRERDA